MKSNYHQKPGVVIATALFAVLFICGAFDPITWWGLSYVTFVQADVLVGVLLIAVVALFRPVGHVHSLRIRSRKGSRYLLPLLVASIYGILIYFLPMAYDPYGDAVYFHSHLDSIGTVNDQIRRNLFGFSLDAWAGQKSMLALITYVSHYLQITHLQAFRLAGLFAGLGFALVWVRFLIWRLTNRAMVIVLSAVGLLSPFSLVFFGHAEIYAVPVLLLLCWCVVVQIQHEGRKAAWLIVSWVLAALCIKAHPIAILLLPSQILITANHWYPSAEKRLTWRMLSATVILPIYLIGAVVYLFVLGDHADDRDLTSLTMQYDHLFLPLFAPAPPLDRYNLLSWNHILDFINVALLLSPAAVFLLSVALLEKHAWSQMRVMGLKLLMLPLILILSLLFVINPILSMPIDWDLYALIVPLLLCVCALLFSSSRTVKNQVYAASVGLMISVLSFSFVVMHRSTESISYRLEAIAIHIHRTYYEWTAQTMDRAFQITPLTPKQYEERKIQSLNMLGSSALDGVDREYSRLLRYHAKYLSRQRSEHEKALAYIDSALMYWPSDGNNHMIAMEVNFRLGKMRDAYEHARVLVELKHPSEERAVKMAIHCALEADLPEQALAHTIYFRKNWTDPIMEEVHQALTTNTPIEPLKSLFHRTE